MERRVQITICGGSGRLAPLSEEALELAYETGKLIAEKGYVLITGGLEGVMEQASKGASEAGGIVIGILPGSKKEDANKYCNIVIPTDISWSRDRIDVYAADGVILINGYIGTDMEARMAVARGTPTVALRSSGGVAEELADTIPYEGKSTIYSAETPEEALVLLDALIKK